MKKLETEYGIFIYTFILPRSLDEPILTLWGGLPN